MRAPVASQPTSRVARLEPWGCYIWFTSTLIIVFLSFTSVAFAARLGGAYYVDDAAEGTSQVASGQERRYTGAYRPCHCRPINMAWSLAPDVPVGGFFMRGPSAIKCYKERRGVADKRRPSWHSSSTISGLWLQATSPLTFLEVLSS